jgi:hypothetical protein
MKKISRYRLLAVPVIACIALVTTVIVAPALQKLTGSVQNVRAAGTDLGSLSGYAWSDNLGWISFSGVTGNGSSYGVTIKADNTLDGYAWANPRDDVSTTDNIGWISFNAADTASCGFGAATLTGTTITGGAKVLSADNNGWNGCISLSGTFPSYGVTLNSSGSSQSGTLDGHAWADSTVGGWISFNCTSGGPTANNICATSNYAVLYTTATVPPPPPPSATISFTSSPSRVRSGTTSSLVYTVTSPVSCTITGSDGSSYPVTVDSTQHTVSTGAISRTILYTLTCDSTSRTTTVGTLPVYQEL